MKHDITTQFSQKIKGFKNGTSLNLAHSAQSAY